MIIYIHPDFVGKTDEANRMFAQLKINVQKDKKSFIYYGVQQKRKSVKLFSNTYLAMQVLLFLMN